MGYVLISGRFLYIFQLPRNSYTTPYIKHASYNQSFGIPPGSSIIINLKISNASRACSHTPPNENPPILTEYSLPHHRPQQPSRMTLSYPPNHWHSPCAPEPIGSPTRVWLHIKPRLQRSCAAISSGRRLVALAYMHSRRGVDYARAYLHAPVACAPVVHNASACAYAYTMHTAAEPRARESERHTRKPMVA